MTDPGSAICRNLLPRPGLMRTVVPAGRCLGRFVADRGAWYWRDATSDREISGQGDALVSLARQHEEVKRRFPEAGIIGYISYEAGYHWLKLPLPPVPVSDRCRHPAMQFLFFERLTSAPAETAPSGRQLVKEYTRAASEAILNDRRLHAHLSRDRYLAQVERIKTHIAAGDIYQANFTQAFDITTMRPPDEIARRIMNVNPAPYAWSLRFDAVTMPDRDQQIGFPAITITSSSPERFWCKTGDRVESRPIKGTMARSIDPTIDRHQRRTLLRSAKDHAELLMITDLVRNDLGKVARIGTVQTEALRRPRAAPAVWHLESIISAEVDPEVGWTDIMRALFPGGSITGAPKRRAVQILSDGEALPRGVYCGAIGWVDADGDADFALGIRTAIQVGNTVRVFGGGGIVADSIPESEYDESLVKIAPILDAVTRDEEQDDDRTIAETHSREEAHG
jgi:anthranilate/para-aminobenzoate synthase component I